MADLRVQDAEEVCEPPSSSTGTVSRVQAAYSLARRWVTPKVPLRMSGLCAIFEANHLRL